MDLNLLTDYLRQKHPAVDGLSVAVKLSDELDPKTIEISFAEGVTKEEQEAARKELDELDLREPLPGRYKEYREAEYSQIPQGNSNDALIKAVQILIRLAISKGIATEKELRDLDIFPDASKDEDTPAGLLGRIQAIKEKYPKE